MKIFTMSTFGYFGRVVLAVVRLPRDLVVDGTGVITKSESLGVIDIEAPVVVKIRSSPL